MSNHVKWHQRLHFDGGSIASGNSEWDANAGKSLVSGGCNWDTAARLIRELNGQNRTYVFLGYMGDEGVDQQLAISGGNAGRYLVVAQELGRFFYLARRPVLAFSGELVEVMVGGLPSYYPSAIVQGLSATMDAAGHYFRTGRRGRKLSWMRCDVAERLRRGAEDKMWRSQS